MKRLGLSLLLIGASVFAAADTQAPTAGAWQSLRVQLYGTREIGEGSDELMSVEAPASTPDPSATPVVVHFGRELSGNVKQVRVIIDNNPSPLVTTMNLGPACPWMKSTCGCASTASLRCALLPRRRTAV